MNLDALRITGGGVKCLFWIFPSTPIRQAQDRLRQAQGERKNRYVNGFEAPAWEPLSLQAPA